MDLPNGRYILTNQELKSYIHFKNSQHQTQNPKQCIPSPPTPNSNSLYSLDQKTPYYIN